MWRVGMFSEAVITVIIIQACTLPYEIQSSPVPPFLPVQASTIGGLASNGIRYAGPIVYTNEKPPIIHFPKPPIPSKHMPGTGWSTRGKQIQYIPMPAHDLPVLVYQSDTKPPIHVVHPPDSHSHEEPQEHYTSPSELAISHAELQSELDKHASELPTEYQTRPKLIPLQSAPKQTQHFKEAEGAESENKFYFTSIGSPSSQESKLRLKKPMSHKIITEEQIFSPSSFSPYSEEHGFPSTTVVRNYHPIEPPRVRGFYESFDLPDMPTSQKFLAAPSHIKPAYEPFGKDGFTKSRPPHIIYQGHPPIHIMNSIQQEDGILPQKFRNPSGSAPYHAASSEVQGPNHNQAPKVSYMEGPTYTDEYTVYEWNHMGPPPNEIGGFKDFRPVYNEYQKVPPKFAHNPPLAPPKRFRGPLSFMQKFSLRPRLHKPKPKYEFGIAPKSWHKPPIIIYEGSKPPVHVYLKNTQEKTNPGEWDMSGLASEHTPSKIDPRTKTTSSVESKTTQVNFKSEPIFIPELSSSTSIEPSVTTREIHVSSVQRTTPTTLDSRRHSSRMGSLEPEAITISSSEAKSSLTSQLSDLSQESKDDRSTLEVIPIASQATEQDSSPETVTPLVTLADDISS